MARKLNMRAARRELGIAPENAARATLRLVSPKSNVLTMKVRTFIDVLQEKIGRAPVFGRTADRHSLHWRKPGRLKSVHDCFFADQ